MANPTGRRKENIPPRLNCNAPPEQRNIQKNVHLSFDPFRDVSVSHRSSGAAVPASDCSRAAAHGKPRVAFAGGTKPHCRVLVQTNLSCPYQPFWDTPSGVSGGSSRQQSNLETKLGCRRSENVACVGDPCCHCAVDGGLSCSGLDRVRLKSSSKNDFSDRRQRGSQKPRGGVRLHAGVPCSCNDTSQSGNKDPRVLKYPRGSFCISEGSYTPLGTAGDPFQATNLYEGTSTGSCLHDQRLHPEKPSSSLSSSSPGPGLTLDHLRSSASVESHATPATLQVLLNSSRVSADLHRSIQRLNQEADSMGALGSFPWEPKASPLPHPSRFDPRVSAAAVDQHAGEENCAKRARVRWQNSFARDWGLSSTAGTWEEPPPFGYGCRNTGLYVHSMEAPNQFWPSAFYGGLGPASSMCGGEEGCPSPSFCYRECCPGIQQVLEREGPSGRLKARYHQKMLDAERLSSKFFYPSELGRGDAPLCRSSFNGLEVSLETLSARPPVTVGVTVDGTQREVHVMVRSPKDGQLGNGSKNVDLCGLQDEPATIDRILPTVQSTDEAALFLSACSSLEEIAGKCLGGHSSAGMGSRGPSSFGGSIKNRSNKDFWADVGFDRGEESPTEKNAESSTFPHCEESRHGMDTVQRETLGRNSEVTDGERSRVPPESIQLLAKCFAAWRDRVFGKRAAAQALYEQQLLRKGLGALKWAVELRHVQVGIARRRQSWTMLAASFRRWQAATARRQKKRASQVKTEACNKDSPAALGGEQIARRPPFHQLSAEHLEAAIWYSRAEGNLWLRIHRDQEIDKMDRTARVIRDMRRLAAAFRLWCLQKERLDEKESRAREACALLEKKWLRNAFETWQSRHRAAEKILPLRAQIQRRLVCRCFNTWKGFAEREACGRHSRDRRRVRVLRLCFQQWARMVQAQEQTRKTLQELLALRREMACARFGFTLNTPKTQPHLNVVRQSERNGLDTLDGLCAALVLQEPFYTWKARWYQQQQLDAFRQTTEERLLRRALTRWHRKAFCQLPLRCCTMDLVEETPLATLDSDEFSVSSGFHSNTPAPPASGEWVEREDSSPDSISLVAITDPGHLLHRLSTSLTPSPGQEDFEDAVAFRDQASSPWRNQHSGKDAFVRGPFESVMFLSPECGLYSTTASSSGEGASPGGEGKDVLQHQRQLLARYFALWSSRTLQNLKGKRHRRHSLLSWAFISWSTAAARPSEWRKAQVWLECTRYQRLLSSCFERWKSELTRAQERREEDKLQRRPTGRKVLRRWRKAVRGSQALRLTRGTVIQQSSNYWTKAAAFYRCLQERSSLVSAPKFMKMPFSWPSKRRRNREEGLPPSLTVRARLNGSAFHVWLVIYRSQRAGPSQQGPRDSPGEAKWEAKHTEIQSSSTETDTARWLGRKYLRLWRLNVLLRHFREAWRMRHLVGAWLLWKDACQTECLVQALARQRLAEWGWKAWRRRYLQTQVAEHFIVAQDKTLLKRAFERWRHLAAEVSDRPQGS